MSRAWICLLILVALCAAVSAEQQKTEHYTKPVADRPGASVPKQVTPTAKTGKNAQEEYVIGESDVLSINVWKEPELTKLLPVRPDGKISLPLIGEIQAAGVTPGALQAVITEKLKQYMENPEVSVIVQEARSKYFSVMGEVAKPGAYPLGQQITVLDALALAGGFRDFAKVTKIYVLRTPANGKTERLPFNYKQALKGSTGQNFLLQPRDTIVVP